MDWGRYLRAQEAAGMWMLEQRRAAYFAGKLGEDDGLGGDEWEVIQEHDRLIADGDTES